MKRLGFTAMMGLVAFLGWTVAGDAAVRTALVIGNAAYDTAPLANPANDAGDMADALRDMGFDVIERINADKRTMVQAVDEFGRKLARSNVAFFYYAGHGMQVRGRNYLIPVKARVASESDVEFEAVDAGRILGKMREAGNKLNIVVLDACRDNPFKRSFRSDQKGLGKMDAPLGSLIAYATSPGSVAADGGGRNGIYTKHLLENIQRPDLSVQDVFTETGLGVMKETGNRQVPWTSSTPIPRYILAGGSVVEEGPTEAPEAKTGSLEVETSPSGADVFVDGKFTGTAPETVTGLSPQRLKVRASKDGFRDAEEPVYIRAGRKTRITLLLDRIETGGTVAVSSNPPGAKWYLDGAYVGTTPDAMGSVSAGSHRVEVQKEGFQDWKDSVHVRTGEKAAVHAELAAERTEGRAGETWTEPVTGMEFVWVPGGCYEMGCGSWTSDCDDEETPVHEVCVDGFWMGKYEVSQGQWREIMHGNPSRFKKGDDYPVEQVSWNDAQEFIQKLKGRSSAGGSFRLPTEAEWEYACRSGGKREKFAGGSDADRVAWYRSNSGGRTHEVGTQAPNGLGIYDMSGNVWEWCEDVYAKDAYSRHARNNPIVESGGSGRVARGGSWGHGPGYVRCANRSRGTPGRRSHVLGFRLARTP